MPGDWDDFDNPARCNKRKKDSKPEKEKIESGREAKTSPTCDWGFDRRYNQISSEESNDLTSNNEGNDLPFKTEQLNDKQYVCTIDVPLDDQDFTLSSSRQSTYSKRQQNEDEEEDERDLLEKKRLLMEANKEDDIELDSTSLKRHSDTRSVSDSIGLATSVNTYESLMAKWNELNMLILQLKAKLVKLDLGVTQKYQQQQQSSSNKAIFENGVKDKSGDDDGQVANTNVDDEIDPLDEYMSTLDTKTKLSMDEKIEKSRIKSQIVSYEREQSEVSRLIELAKPKFNFDKACPPTVKRT